MGAWLISEARRSSPPGMVSRSAVNVRTGRRLWSPAVPRRGGGICCCIVRITAGLPVTATGRGLRRAGHASPARPSRVRCPRAAGGGRLGGLSAARADRWGRLGGVRPGGPVGTEVVVDGEEHDRFEWVSFAEARRRCQPAELEASFLAGSGTPGFG